MADTECEARRLASQEVHCWRCGLRWDADDTAPPTCGKLAEALGMQTPKAETTSAAVVSLRGSAIMGGKPVSRGSLVDRLAALCETMRAGVVTCEEAADMLEDLTVEVGTFTG